MKKRLVLFALVILALIGVYTLTNKSEPGQTWQQQYDLGVRYLSEGNYEEAVIAFMAAIEIDPKRVETYVALADLYEAMGDADKLLEILENGVEATGDEALAERLEKLKKDINSVESVTGGADSDNASAENDKTNSAEYSFESLVFFENILTTDDIPLVNMSFDEAAAHIGADFFFEHEGREQANAYTEDDTSGYNYIDVYRYSGDREVSDFAYYGYEHLTTNTEIRGICLGDSFETVLIKMGIETEAAKWISENSKNIDYYSDIGQYNGIAYVLPAEEHYNVAEGTDIEDYRQITVHFIRYVENHNTDSIAFLDFLFYKGKLDQCFFTWIN